MTETEWNTSTDPQRKKAARRVDDLLLGKE